MALLRHEQQRNTGSYSGSFTGSFLGSVIGTMYGTVTGSVLGTSSWAENFFTQSVTSASYSETASYIETAQTASYFFTSSVTSASYALSASNADTASYTRYAISSSFGATSSYLNPLQQNIQITGSLNISGSFVATSFTSSTVTSQTIFSSASNTLGSNPITDIQKLVGSVEITGSLHAPSITGSLLGTASWAQSSLIAQTASYFITTSVTSASIADFAIMASNVSGSEVYVQTLEVLGNTTLGDDPYADTLTVNSLVDIFGQTYIWNTFEANGKTTINDLTGSLYGTASWAENAVNTLTASFINPLNQKLELTGSLEILGPITASSIHTQTITSSISFITGSSKFGSLLTNTHEFTGSVSITGSLTITGSLRTSIYNREIHVSNISGNDTTGNGSILAPYKTITKAFSVVGNTAESVVIHPGTYTESPTITAVNVTIASAQGEIGGICLINGTLTINGASSSTRLQGLAIVNLVHSGAGNLYLDSCQVNASFTKSSTGYFEAIESEVVNANITGANQTVFNGGKQTLITVNNAAATVSILGSLAAAGIIVTSGTFIGLDSIIYATSIGANAINSSPGTIVQLNNCSIIQPDLTAGRISISGFLGYDDIQFDKTNSTEGTWLWTKAHFQSIETNNITGSLFGTASAALFASSSISSSYTVSSSFAQTASFIALPYAQFSDTTIQSGSANIDYAMKLNTTEYSSGISVQNNNDGFPTRITAQAAGIYNLQFSAQLGNTANTNIVFYIWFRVSGLDLPNSTTVVEVDKQSGALGRAVAAWNILVTLGAGEYVEIMWSCNDNTGELVSETVSAVIPDVPSVIATITKIA